MISLIRAKSSDISDIIDLERDAFKDSSWDEESLREALNCSYDRLFIARDGEDALGYIFLRLTEPAEILRVAVKSTARRQGIGTLLLEAAVSDAREALAESILLELRADNTAAFRLYEKAGFKVISRRKGYYRAPACDALIMRYIC